MRLILFALGVRDFDQALGSFAVFFEEGGEAGWSRRRRDHSMLLKEFNELRLVNNFVNSALTLSITGCGVPRGAARPTSPGLDSR